MRRFALASLTPVALLGAACLWGGAWVWVALGSITVAAVFLDRLAVTAAVSQASGRALCVTLALAHFALLVAGVHAVGGGDLSGAERAGLFVALGLTFGQVSNSNAHELIHAAPRVLRRLGAAVYVSLLHGAHVPAHMLVHHVHAATDRDPNSARLGEPFWRFALRASVGEWRAGYAAERARGRMSLGPHLAGSAAFLGVSFWVVGPGGVLVHLGLAAYAQLQLLLSDYVQHYGLRRAVRPDGRVAPMGPAHSWNAPQWYTGAMMLNAPRHSDHHMRPTRPFPALELDGKTMPTLPRSLPVMAALALVPPLWRRVMDRRVARWQGRA